ncbi:MAG: S8 family serine peptidase [Phycisphaerales bacterium]|nr:S8 family serine peptidase [Phycisphaerales bacterium]MCB9864425.1 S8 family serine peptidase [Phycisphaerales bacterium]
MGNHFARVGGAAMLLLLMVGSVAAGQTVDDNLLYLRAATINPLELPSILESKTPKLRDSDDYVLKLDGPMTPARRKALHAAGVKLGEYIPRHAWRVALPNANLDAIRGMDFVTWLGEFDPSWKLCPNLSRVRTFKTLDRTQLQTAGRKRVVLHLAPGATRESVQRNLAACGAIECDPPALDRVGNVTVELDAARLGELCNVAAIRFIEEAPEAAPRNQSTEWIAQSNIPNVTSVWDQGLHGENQLVGVIDWDLDETHCAFEDVGIPFGDMHRKIQAYYGFDQNTLFGWHGTHVVDTLAGDPLDAMADANLRGMAYASRIVFQDQAATITASNLFDRLQIAHDDGARIHSNSWGATIDNSYNAWARDIDDFSYQNEDDLVIFAVINGGAATPILSPENAKNCLAVGASGEAPNQGDPGSGGTGPTIDGRQKPEVWMPACNSVSANFGTDCGVTTRACATSWAAPATAGVAALTRQYFTDGFYPNGAANPDDAIVPSGSLLKAMLINSAVDMSGIAGYHGPREGWGRVLLEDALYFAGDSRRLLVEDVRHDEGLVTDGSAVYDIDVLSADEPLKITLVFADAPSTVGTSFAPVNDLDLVVTSPSGQTYLGNVFELAESTTGGVNDALNNNEQVHRAIPETGTWRIEVLAREVNVGMQGYALVVTGDVATVGAPEADLEVSLTPAGPISAEAGDLIDVKLNVRNHGPDIASNVHIHYELPAGLAFGNKVILPMECAMTANELSCSIPELGPDQDFSVATRLRVVQTGEYLTTAAVSSDTPDSIPENDSAALRIETSASADLELNLIDAPTTLLQGRSANIRVEVRNLGPGADPTPMLVVTADAGLSIDALSPCSAMPNDATCSLTELSSTDSIVVTANVRASASAVGARNVRLQVTGALDVDESNNTIDVSVNVIADSDADGVADADDICPEGDDRVDGDNDGVPDACDDCPNDPEKSAMGVCGCGMPETDSDSDGIPDCADFCPADPDKIMPGDCGCGASEEDTNNNGVPDCLDTPIDNPDPGNGEDPIDIFGDEPIDEFTLDDLDPCFVRFLLQSFLGIPLCGPCISFGAIGSFAGIIAMRRRSKRRRRSRRAS